MTIATLWSALVAAGDWEPAQGPAQIEAVLRTLPPAPELEELYARANGGSVGGVEVFSLDELANVNAQRGYRTAFPCAVFFSSDGGDRFFFLDTDGALGRGAGAVIVMDRGAARPELCVLAATDLDAFFGAAIRGERPWLGRPTFGETEVDDLLATVGAAGDKVQGRPYDVASDALLDAVERCGVQLPTPLAVLLGEVDGARIPAAGITLWPAERIEPVPDLPADNPRFPALIWFAEDDLGERYAVVASAWRGVAPGTVLQVTPGADPVAAPILGRFAAVVTAWVRS